MAQQTVLPFLFLEQFRFLSNSFLDINIMKCKETNAGMFIVAIVSNTKTNFYVNT